MQLILFIFLGLVTAQLAGLEDLQDSHWYFLTVSVLLAAGLYASTFGIVLKEARQHLRIIVSAVTVGVVLKAAIIGGSLAVIFQDPFFIILGITVAQIDPLSVAGLMKGGRLSAKAKTILASWASFDDPVTVILALYSPVLVAHLTGMELGAIANTTGSGIDVLAYVKGVGLNVLLAATALSIWHVIRRYGKRSTTGASYGLLAAVFSVAVLHFMMLGIALSGLFLRPQKAEIFIDDVITWALRIAAVLLGFLLVDGISLWKGMALGAAAYAAQVIVGFLLTRSLPIRDRWHISFAQQNGITAIVLSLLFEPIHPGTVAIVAPAIIVINGLHAVANKRLDVYLARHHAQKVANDA